MACRLLVGTQNKWYDSFDKQNVFENGMGYGLGWRQGDNGSVMRSYVIFFVVRMDKLFNNLPGGGDWKNNVTPLRRFCSVASLFYSV